MVGMNRDARRVNVLQLDDGPVCQGVGEGEANCQEAKDCLT